MNVTRLVLAALPCFIVHAADTPGIVAGSKDWGGQGQFSGCRMTAGRVIELERKNRLQNSSFEWDFQVGRRSVRDGMAFGWGLWGKGRAYGLYQSTSVPSFAAERVDGARSQRIDFKAKGTTPLHVSQDVWGIRPGERYTFSAYVKVAPPKQLEASVAMSWIGDDLWVSAAEPVWASPAAFTRLHVSGAAPAGATRVRCAVYFRPKRANGAGAVWLDAAQFEQSDRATAYTPCYGRVQGDYVSPPLDLSPHGAPYKLSWIAVQPSATDLRFQLRSAQTRDGLEAAQWRGPEGADAYAAAIEAGPNLVRNPSVETMGAEAGRPAGARVMGYGDNDRAFETVADSHSGDRAVKVAITSHRGGNARWEVAWDGPFEPNARYAFGLWHKEDSAHTPISMSVAIQQADGAMRWGGFSQTKKASTSWKRDVIYFTMPALPVKRLYPELNLSGVGWTITDDYSLRRVLGAEEWPVDPAHRGDRWLQYRATFTTSDPALGPKLFRAEIACGPCAPEIRWLNVMAEDGQRQCYSFRPGQTALFLPQVIDYSSVEPVRRVTLSLMGPSGQVVAKADMERGDSLSKEEAFFRGRYTFPPAAALGEWRAVVAATNRAGRTGRAMAVLKVRQRYRSAPQRMRIAALVTDYGFGRYKGAALQQLIAHYRRAVGLEIWKMSVQWARMEPTPGQFNPDVIEGLRAFIRAAHESGATAQIGIQQQVFPEWVNNGDWDSARRYQYQPTKRLADTWRRLAAALKDTPGLDSYLLINEENAVRDADLYLRAMSKVQAAVREVDPDRSHRITIRPNTREPYIRTRIASHGAQDYDYGSGGYPTSAAWYFKQYANPVSQTACTRMATFHACPYAFGGPGGIGEVGFFVRKSRDSFGDRERLEGFKRAMRIAYEMGMDEFHLWGGTFSFDDLETYYPKLVAFRDALVSRPRPGRIDVRVVMETGQKLYVNKPSHSSKLDMSQQPWAAVCRYLDGKGYVWHYTTEQAMEIQDLPALATVRLADLAGKPAAEQVALLDKLLSHVRPSGTPLPWPDNAD